MFFVSLSVMKCHTKLIIAIASIADVYWINSVFESTTTSKTIAVDTRIRRDLEIAYLIPMFISDS